MKKPYFLVIALFLSTLVLKAQNYTETQLKGALLAERTCFDVGYYDLHLAIFPEKEKIKGYNEITFRVKSTTNQILLDLFNNLQIDSVTFQGKKIDFVRKYNSFFLNFPFPLQINEVHSVKVYYGGRPSVGVGVRKTDGFHWKKYNDKHLVGVSCEIAGASLWIPCKEHLSDEADSVRLHWDVPIELECISNGTLEKLENSKIKGYKTSSWFVRNPINTYNITIYLGDYEHKTGAYRGIDSVKRKISIFFLRNKVNKETQKHHILIASHFVAFAEQTFGQYAFWDDKLAVVETLYNGMEHQSCVAVGSLSEKTVLWYPYGRQYNVHGTLIHELAHEWWGNAVSSADMGDMWLHEGFATYTEYLFLEYMLNDNKIASNYFSRNCNSFQVLADRYVYASEVFGINRIYQGGACFLHKLRKAIANDKIFFDILATYYQQNKKKIVLTEDFIKVVNEKTNQNWEKFFWKNLK
ncbi:MAG: M1 family aminopeptidase [Thermonemataceae bacterium]|nr:M1 family aminopeptidase [Thermonemataceae bacterium]